MELIYSVKHIFDDNTQQGCLSQYNVNKYHIPAYQRGYKWSSEKNGAVTVLLNDLWGAYKKAPDKEYYLQYITVKQDAELNHLELIDGQQRITTLSILLSVCAQIFEFKNTSENKLDYAVRTSFFRDYIFNHTNLKMLLEADNWSSFIDSQPLDLDKQDIYYFFQSAKKIYNFINKETKKDNDFFEFILNKVKIIVNAVEAHIVSETVFKNLNSNKVPLTEVELIKGLFITRVGRANELERTKSFMEITQNRARIGQQWDEITKWSCSPKIASYYFNGKTGMHQFLTLVAVTLKYKVSTEKIDFPVFNFFLKQDNFIETFNSLLYNYWVLKDWYNDTEKYNLIGFVRFAKNSGNNTIEYLKDLLEKNTNSSLMNQLIKEHTKLIEGNLRDMNYGESDDKIHAVLLYLNVFSDREKTRLRFNFYDYIKEKWTLEHIFPQSPEGKNTVLSEDNKNEIFEMLGGENSLEKDVVLALKKETRTEDEKQLYYSLLQSSEYLNSIGNMCLLTGKDNSSNGCMFFNEKRSNTLKRIQKGSFVPKHTFDVFSKMITEDMSKHSIDTWSKKDIEVHINWMQGILKPIL